MTKNILCSFAVALGLFGAIPVWAAPEFVTCDPIEVATYPERIHVRCAASIGGISFFARSTSVASDAARFLTTLTAAQVAGRTLSILTDLSDTSGTAFGCLATDCRVMQSVGFGN